jgi:hypothetical protein
MGLVYFKKSEINPKWKTVELTSLDHGPLTSSGFKTFCHLCKHWTSVLPGKDSAGEKKVVYQALVSDKDSHWQARGKGWNSSMKIEFQSHYCKQLRMQYSHWHEQKWYNHKIQRMMSAPDVNFLKYIRGKTELCNNSEIKIKVCSMYTIYEHQGQFFISHIQIITLKTLTRRALKC